MSHPTKLLIALSPLLFSFGICYGDAATLPKDLTSGDFSALTGKSPFTRSLDLPGSLILTGFAKIDGADIATVADTTTSQTYTVSTSPNSKGWKLVSKSGGTQLEDLRVTISSGGGETFRVGYDEDQHQQLRKLQDKARKERQSQAKAESKANKPKDDDQKSKTKQAYSDLKSRFSNLSDTQRAKARELIKKGHQENPGMNSEARSKMYNGVLDKVESKK